MLKPIDKRILINYIIYRNNNDTPENIYADREGDCEIEKEDIKSEEPYITIDTIGGNHITWEAKQI